MIVIIFSKDYHCKLFYLLLKSISSLLMYSTSTSFQRMVKYLYNHDDDDEESSLRLVIYPLTLLITSL